MNVVVCSFFVGLLFVSKLRANNFIQSTAKNVWANRKKNHIIQQATVLMLLIYLQIHTIIMFRCCCCLFVFSFSQTWCCLTVASAACFRSFIPIEWSTTHRFVRLKKNRNNSHTISVVRLSNMFASLYGEAWNMQFLFVLKKERKKARKKITIQ